MFHKHQPGTPVRCHDKGFESGIAAITTWVAAVNPDECEMVTTWNGVHTYPGEHFDRIHGLVARLGAVWQERLAGARRGCLGADPPAWKCDEDGPVQLVLAARFSPVNLPEAYLENLEAPYREIHALIMACRGDNEFAAFAGKYVANWESSVAELVREAEANGATHDSPRLTHRWH